MGTVNAKGLRPGLYAITDGKLLPPDRLVPAVEAALRGGATLVQYREKSLPHAERLRLSSNLVAACRNAGVPLIINDDPQLAKRVAAGGVHMGQSDGSLASARRLLGDDAILGATCHASLDLAAEAIESSADYLAFGRFFSSGTKPDAPSAEPGILGEARAFEKPVTAIGGITLDNGESLIRAGADLLAVVGGLFDGDDTVIEDRARQFTRLFAAHHPLF
ncbi:thiamine phosphate synthase [Marinobacter sp. CHS3-4]|uniref:thiamine phosphate synthase n=1 Tax=Marinobacter sp. CHS3-4 TaxID=3045174 RepID=UPI0024B62F5A|nr:thiamine phosphate synthase [Marinobacter sp. CHS3-4]MDI9246602.1 thiamine phosphate synthase [Marinobacter sp. CHS3-4]